ncbi:AbrB/MazE/SpoVT family DNA-binding domain-containing protein [Candidatus Gottesmanbacteria bacterium]|nr:AbrB/MazE/SpoVT family DNA-binding domain-containing protein [Candidatus Gottesmanbacteria bacterium]
MQTNIVTISDKWQVVIPKYVRKKLQIKPKDKVLVYPVGSQKIVVDTAIDNISRQTDELFGKYPSDDLYYSVLAMTRGKWQEDWQSLKKKRRKIELAASKRRKQPW